MVLDNNNVASFVAGHVAGMCGVFAGAPFDLVKVKLQTAKLRYSRKFPWLQKRNYANGIECAKHIFEKHGSVGFYRGILPPMIAVGFQKSLAFGVYQSTRNLMETKGKASLYQVMLAGAAGGFANSIILCPVDQLKIAMQVDRSKALVQTTQRLIEHNSSAFRAFYGAMGSVLLREIPGYALYFTTYESLTRTATYYRGQQPSKAVNFVAGGAAGMMMWLVYYPLDFIKSTAQARNASLKEKPLSPFNIAQSVYQKQGIRAFYRGVGPAVLRAFPTHACIFLVYETLMRSLHCDE